MPEVIEQKKICRNCRFWRRSDVEAGGYAVCTQIHGDSGLLCNHAYLRTDKNKEPVLVELDLVTPEDFTCGHFRPTGEVIYRKPAWKRLAGAIARWLHGIALWLYQYSDN